MRSFLRQHRKLVRAALTSFCTLLLLSLGYRLLGHHLVELLWPSVRERLAGDAPPTLERALEKADSLARVALALGWSLYALALLLVALLRLRPGAWVGTAWVLAFYVFLELYTAPRLVAVLGLPHYVLARDPDHRPAGMEQEPGWNRDNLVQTRQPEEYRPDQFNIVFLGDSFTMGLKIGRPHEDAFPQVVGALLCEELGRDDVQVANFAWVSASPLLSLRRLRDLGDRYHPDLVVLCLDMTDPHDDLKYRNVIERRGITWFYDRLPLAVLALRRLAPAWFESLYHWSTDHSLPANRFFHSAQPLEESRPFLMPTLGYIQAIRDEALARDAPLVVFVLPRYYQYSDRESPDDWEMKQFGTRDLILGPYCREPFRFFEEVAATADYPIHSLLAAFESTDVHPHCFRDDPHWNTEGHKVAAAAVLEKLLPIVRDRLRTE